MLISLQANMPSGLEEQCVWLMVQEVLYEDLGHWLVEEED